MRNLIFDRNYFCSPQDVEQMELDIVNAAETATSDGIVLAWVDPRSRLANYVRTLEAGFFPEVADLEPEYDYAQRMFVLVDMSDRRVVHAASFYEYQPRLDPEAGELTGFYTIDSMIRIGHLTASRFYEHCSATGVKPEWCLSVETNMRVGQRRSARGTRGAYLAYAVLAQELMRKAPSLNVSGVFASANEKQLASFGEIGMRYSRILDLDENATEESELGRYSLPVMLLMDGPMHELLKGLMAELAGEVFLPA